MASFFNGLSAIIELLVLLFAAGRKTDFYRYNLTVFFCVTRNAPRVKDCDDDSGLLNVVWKSLGSTVFLVTTIAAPVDGLNQKVHSHSIYIHTDRCCRLMYAYVLHYPLGVTISTADSSRKSFANAHIN